MLRSHGSLLQSLRLSDREILKSHIAAKLNGYVGGFGNLGDFEKVHRFICTKDLFNPALSVLYNLFLHYQ